MMEEKEIDELLKYLRLSDMKKKGVFQEDFEIEFLETQLQKHEIPKEDYTVENIKEKGKIIGKEVYQV